MLVTAVDDADELQDVEAAEGDERDAFVGFLAPDGERLGDEECGVAQQCEAEDDCDDILHGWCCPVARCCLRSFTLTAGTPA